MKRALYFFKFFSFCLLVSYIISSCASSSGIHGDKEKLEKAVIRITDSNPGTNVLTLLDSSGNSADTFRVISGQKIKWKIEDPKVKSIKKMSEKAGNHNVFSKRPHKVFLSKNWKGKIKETDKNDEEAYYIEWKDGDNNSHTYDPLIQVRPQQR